MSQQDTDGNFIYFQYDTGGTPVGMLYNDRQYYYVTNQFGDVTVIIDEDGYIVCEYVYGDWGEILDITGDLEIAEANPLRYRGYYYDNETGYYYLQSRYYDPNICRFINADIFSLVSIDTLLGINIFIYCQNDPINFIDPTGFYKTTNWFEAALRGLCVAIEIDTFTNIFEHIIKLVDKTFNFNEWFDGLESASKKFMENATLFFTTAFNHLFSSGFDLILNNSFTDIVHNFIDNPKDEFMDIIKKFKPNFEKTNIAPFIGLIIDMVSINDDYVEGIYNDWQSFALSFTNAIVSLVNIFIPDIPGVYNFIADVAIFIMEVSIRFVNHDYI